MAKAAGAEALRKIMNERKLKQKDVSEAVRASQGAVSRWLQEKRTPDREHAAVLFRLYGIPVESWARAAS